MQTKLNRMKLKPHKGAFIPSGQETDWAYFTALGGTQSPHGGKWPVSNHGLLCFLSLSQTVHQSRLQADIKLKKLVASLNNFKKDGFGIFSGIKASHW